jgi:predicted aspartyl protease
MTPSETSAHFPYLQVHVKVGSPRSIEQELDVEALIDTGFDGGLTVPSALIDPTITPDTHLPWQLADGSQVLTPAYLATVHIGQLQPVLTVLIALGDEPLLGRSVTDSFRLILDHGAQVIVEP